MLLLDNCTAHPQEIPGLVNIKLAFMPPNVTSVIQPMDAGVNKNLKHHYRKMILQRKILAIENKEEFKLNMKERLFLLARSWNLVTCQTISNCFKKAKIISPPAMVEHDDVEISKLDKTVLSPIIN